ncbi:hypothetical protein ECE50_001020 [Chitinophaga sp. Mgbs1]|uniref:Uncharacterized protein n=1 Tax=Chitinophaga solisilvae TaxID=1233460 RepID=A0A3S1D579_9BACT|nr:hypothetical protein [Chitinophaga solisilvae]
MNTTLKAALRQQAIFIPVTASANKTLSPTTGLLVANIAKMGFGVTETLLHALNSTTPAYHRQILQLLREVMGIDKNWTPLVKEWNIPTGESVTDHLTTWFANVLQNRKAGPALHCGHIIPLNTFPLERYNGCPFCGTPFQAGEIEYYQQNSKVRVLDLWTEANADAFLRDLLTSKTALDATQTDTLQLLLEARPLPQVNITMKETQITVISFLVSKDKAADAQALFTTPTDILRYLWYKHTGFLQIVAPKTIIKRQLRNNQHLAFRKQPDQQSKTAMAASLKLKYGRREALTAARWLNELTMDTAAMCENMHAKRNMWVRFIRALRLAEFSHRKGFEKLHTLLDKFYNEDYVVMQGRIDHFKLRHDAASTFYLLQQRPGLFARSLFANMLWFGPEPTLQAFTQIADKLPVRLLLTLQMYAAYYFNRHNMRSVKPLGGTSKRIPANSLLSLYTDKDLQAMQDAVTDIYLHVMQQRFAAAPVTARTMYIDPALFYIPLAIGDRSEQIQDLPSALMGTRFKVDGDTVRLFMQWGKGLPAQHLDMDLSCRVSFGNRMEICSYMYLTTTGCKHSGDIRSIPHMTGAAEYIELNIPELAAAGAHYVSFTCNAYSAGALVPELVVGWMNSRYPMKISKNSGVAYDPSCVQHQVRITRGLTKGLLFGVLDVKAGEIIWLEMPFDGQIIQQLDQNNISALLNKLESKMNIGQLLQLKAAAQQLEIVNDPGADEAYTAQWAMNTAAVTQLFAG